MNENIIIGNKKIILNSLIKKYGKLNAGFSRIYILIKLLNLDETKISKF